MTEREKLYSVRRDGVVLATGLTQEEAARFAERQVGGWSIEDEGRSVPRQEPERLEFGETRRTFGDLATEHVVSMRERAPVSSLWEHAAVVCTCGWRGYVGADPPDPGAFEAFARAHVASHVG